MADIQQKIIKGPLTLLSVHSSGRCLGINEGKNIFIEKGIPGEEVMYTTHRRKAGFRSGEIKTIISGSAERVTPFCAHYDECSGCNWQHISYGYQLKLKHEILQNALNKYHIDVPIIPDVVPSPHERYYRHRVEYAFSAGNSGKLGFHNTNDPGNVIDIRECWLQSGPSRLICEYIKNYALENGLEFYNQAAKTGFLRSLSIRISRAGEIMVILGFNDERPHEMERLLESIHSAFPEIGSLNYTHHLSSQHSQLQGEIIPYGSSAPFIYENIGPFRFRIHATSFFQPNVEQAENILGTIREWADLKGGERIYDLYTGVGTIAHFLAAGSENVIGIESSAQAILDACENANHNRTHNLSFMQGDILETFRPEFISKHGVPDIIVLDPPRSGTLIEIKKTINSCGAGKVIYLSCNPVSLAFDLKQLTEVYKVTRIMPFDMLPQTHHLETMVMLERESGS